MRTRITPLVLALCALAAPAAAQTDTARQDEALAARAAKAEQAAPHAAGRIERLLNTLDSRPTVKRVFAPQFRNTAVDAGVASAPDSYELAWFRFDNASGRRTYAAFTRAGAEGVAPIPADQRSGAAYIGVDVRAFHPEYPGWSTPVRLYFGAIADGWQPVGLERQPDVAEQRLARN